MTTGTDASITDEIRAGITERARNQVKEYREAIRSILPIFEQLRSEHDDLCAVIHAIHSLATCGPDKALALLAVAIVDLAGTPADAAEKCSHP